MKRKIRIIVLIILALFSLHGCAGCDQRLVDYNVRHLVWIKYAHVANVWAIQGPSPGGTARADSLSGGFWAVFDICSLDVQGSALNGFSYNAANFYVESGARKYGESNPGGVNFNGGNMLSNNPVVLEFIRNSLNLSSVTSYFEKRNHRDLNYRIAIYVKEHPPGYGEGILTLKYKNHPMMLQDVSPRNPDIRSFYNHPVSPTIERRCP